MTLNYNNALYRVRGEGSFFSRGRLIARSSQLVARSAFYGKPAFHAK